MSGWSLEYDIEVDEANNVVYEKIYGIWRTKTAEKYRADFEIEVKPIIDRPWAKLIDLSNWKTAENAVIDIVGRHLAWCRTHNMMWSVNIINNPVTFAHLMRMFERGDTKEISRTFRSYAEGEQFLQQQGFNVRGLPSGRA